MESNIISKELLDALTNRDTTPRELYGTEFHYYYQKHIKSRDVYKPVRETININELGNMCKHYILKHMDISIKSGLVGKDQRQKDNKIGDGYASIGFGSDNTYENSEGEAIIQLADALLKDNDKKIAPSGSEIGEIGSVAGFRIHSSEHINQPTVNRTEAFSESYREAFEDFERRLNHDEAFELSNIRANAITDPLHRNFEPSTDNRSDYYRRTMEILSRPQNMDASIPPFIQTMQEQNRRALEERVAVQTADETNLTYNNIREQAALMAERQRINLDSLMIDDLVTAGREAAINNTPVEEIIDPLINEAREPLRGEFQIHPDEEVIRGNITPTPHYARVEVSTPYPSWANLYTYNGDNDNPILEFPGQVVNLAEGSNNDIRFEYRVQPQDNNGFGSREEVERNQISNEIIRDEEENEVFNRESIEEILNSLE